MTQTFVPPAIAIRVCAALLCGGEVCLIHRQRPDGDQYSLPGGLVEPAEEVPAALARELQEELGLGVARLPYPPVLRWVQDQLTTRPGSDELFRRLHLVHVLPVPTHVRSTVAAIERDASDATRVLWLPLPEAADLHLYPAVGDVLDQLRAPGAPTGPAQLPAITDRTYSWR
ncbi:NUDIX domain-containing protein [Kitasatospora sp. LaBMicrA B282]|uniref:NUDIX domain-containing protein n=1 Tax=Kitasatospora sp. LaBMicrA B282 TaxID=3420949 RepID=UPI003D0F6846